MTKASDNAFPSVLITESTVPSTPAAGKQRVYIDSTTHVLKYVNSSGTASNVSTGSGGIATDTFWAAQGDIAVATGNDTAAVLTKGAAGTVPTAGASTLAYAYPPGYEIDYVQATSGVNCTATSSATADTIITSSAIAYDGSTTVMIEFYAADGFAPNVSGGEMYITLYDGSSSIGTIGGWLFTGGNRLFVPVHVSRRLTPSNASHTYSIRGFVTSGTGGVEAGAGGAGVRMPMFIRITKV